MSLIIKALAECQNKTKLTIWSHRLETAKGFVDQRQEIICKVNDF